MTGMEIAVDPAQLDGCTWAALFGNDHPVEVEIGVGKAGFLLRRAQARPDLNLLGIEWANEFYRYALDRMRRWGVSNVRLVRTDASYFMRVQCPRASLAALHVYHPDPWPKTRHHKRRLFQPAFVAAVAQCLRPGGRLAVQTDHAEYFEIIRGLVLGRPEFEQVPFDDPEFGVEAAGVRTNFEIKYDREGRAMHRLAARRRA